MTHIGAAMNNQVIQLLVLAAIAVFLILKLRSVLGTRDGFEGPVTQERPEQSNRPQFEVIEGGPDPDIIDYVDEGSAEAESLSLMKKEEPSFMVSDFLQGAKGAYEMILMAFENGELSDIKEFLSADVYEAFATGVEARKQQGLTVEANFIGIRETDLKSVSFDPKTKNADVDVRFVSEMTSVVRDNAGDIVEGDASEIKRQRDVWTFSRKMGSNDPNWHLSATGG